MNCHDIGRLLVERKLGHLYGEQQAGVQRHLASCPDCARDVEIHAQLIVLPVPPMPEDLAVRCRAAVAARPAPGRGRRGPGPLLVIGVGLVLAAAAAMLAMRAIDLRSKPAVAVLGPPAAASTPATELPEEIQSDPEATAGPVELPRPFTVHVPPLRYGTEDPLGRTHVQKYYEKLLEELRAVPGLTLLGPDVANPVGATADMRISVTALAVTRFEAATGQSMIRWEAQLDTQVRRSDRTMMSAVIDHETAIVDPECMPEMPETPSCHYRASKAAATQRVESLRLDFFPDSSFRSQFQARLASQLADTALPDVIRLSALSRLRELSGAGLEANSPSSIRARRLAELGYGAAMSLDTAMVHSALDLLATADPRQQLEILRLLRGLKHPDLVPPLIELLRSQTDEALRREVAKMLILDFGDDPAALAATSSSASADSSRILQQLVFRAQSGDRAWRAHVSGTLKNTNLTTRERLAPAVEMLEYFTNADVSAFLQNQEVQADMAVLLREFWRSGQPDFASAGSGLLLQQLQYLGGANPGLITSINIDALRMSTNPLVRRAAVEFLGVWVLPRNRPAVTEAFEYAAEHDENPGVKTAAINYLSSTAATRQRPAQPAVPSVPGEPLAPPASDAR